MISALIIARARAGQVTFINPNSSSWNAPVNWSTGALPTTADDVIIDGLGPNAHTFVTLNTDATINTLNVLLHKRLYIQDGFGLTLNGGTLSNSGSIVIQSTGEKTSVLVPVGGEVTLSGGGSILMQGDAWIAGAGRFINASNRIVGHGVLGGDGIGIENGAAGVIDARPGAGAGFVVDPSSSAGLINRGLMQSSSGGILNLSGSGGGSFDNATGTIRAQDGSQVHLTSGATLVGGTLATVGTGVIRIPDFQGATLQDVINSGMLVVNQTATITLAGSISNTGSINFGGSAGQLATAGVATLSGGGTVHLNNTFVLGGRLINLDNTVRGSAFISGFSPGMLNYGTMVLGGNIFSNAAVPFENRGMLAALAATWLTLSGQSGRDFINTGGVITTELNGAVAIDNSARIIGGKMGPGYFAVQPTTTGTIQDVEFSGQFSISGALGLAGNIQNSGQFMTEGLLTIGGTVTLRGTGYLTVEAAGRVGGSGTLINEGNQIIGVGNLGNNSISIDNRAGGLIASRLGYSSSTFVIDPAPGGYLLNSGTLRAGQGSLVLSGNGGGSFDSSNGIIEILGGATLSTTAGAILRAGRIDNAGVFAHGTDAQTGSIEGAGIVNVLSGATLSASRFRQQELALSSGALVTLRPAGATAPANRLSTLDISGSPGAWSSTLDLTDNALVIDYSGASPLQMIQSQLTSGYADGSWTGPGIVSSTAGATATTANPTALGFAHAADLFSSFPAEFRGETIDATTILVMHTLAGDANLDGMVNLLDFNALASNFGLSGKRWSQGDFTYGGSVNVADFNLLAGNFNLSAGADGVVDPEDWAALLSVVPEPSALLLSGVATLVAMSRTQSRPR